MSQLTRRKQKSNIRINCHLRNISLENSSELHRLSIVFCHFTPPPQLITQPSNFEKRAPVKNVQKKQYSNFFSSLNSEIKETMGNIMRNEDQ